MSGPVKITPEILSQLAESYEPTTHEAPVVIGHPATDEPAWGWIKASELRPDGLWLEVELTPEIVELIQQGRYKKVSISIYSPEHPANPHPGMYTIKHLGLLGAQPPAVKALHAIGFSVADEGVITIQFSTPKEKAMDPEEIAAKAAALAQKEQTINLSEQSLGQREQTLAQREKALRKQELTAKIQPHIQAGRVLPRQQELVLSLAEKIDGQTLNFSEGGEKPLLEEFLNFLEQLPQQVPLGEKAASANALPAANAPISFAAPAGYEVDPESAALYAKAKDYQRQHPGVDILEAVNAIGGNK